MLYQAHKLHFTKRLFNSVINAFLYIIENSLTLRSIKPKYDDTFFKVFPYIYVKMNTRCFLYNKNTNYCRGQSSKLQREFPYYCRVLFGIFLSPQFLWV